MPYQMRLVCSYIQVRVLTHEKGLSLCSLLKVACGQEGEQATERDQEVMRHRKWGLEQDMEKSESNRETSTRGEICRQRLPVHFLVAWTPEIITQKVCAHVSICSSVRYIGLK